VRVRTVHARLACVQGQRPTATAPARPAPLPWTRPSTTTTGPQECGSSASPVAAAPTPSSPPASPAH